jgi:opacity protein-like surface antigen
VAPTFIYCNMKKIYILRAALFFAATCLSVSTVCSQSVEIGARLMPVFSDFNFVSSSGGTIKGQTTLGMGYGAFLGVNLSKHVGIQGEVIYNSLSQKYNEPGRNREINVRYLNIPILLSLNTGKTSVVNVNVVAGPQFGVNQSSRLNTDSDDGVTTAQGVLSIKKNDFGFAYGAGIDFGLPRLLRLDFGFRGVLGMIDISDNSEPLVPGSYYILDRTHTKTYSVYAGLSVLI